MKSLLSDKRGASILSWILSIVGIILLIIVLVQFWPTDFTQTVNGVEVTYKLTDTISTKDVIVNSFGDGDTATKISPVVGNVLQLIMGKVPKIMAEKSGELNSLIALLCIFAIFGLVFGDILGNFSSLSTKTAKIVGFLLAVAAANLGLIGMWAGAFTQIFAVFGMVSVYGGLLASFVVFFVIEWGIGGDVGNWIFRRKMLHAAAKSEVKTEAGAKKVASFIRGAKEGADAFAGKKK